MKHLKRLRTYLLDRSAINHETGCREWLLSVGSHGYGNACSRFFIRKPQGVTVAHRLSWRAWKGRIPKGKKVLHRCDNKRCIEPKHLFLGTDRDNCYDKLKKGRGGYENHAFKVWEGRVNKNTWRCTPEKARLIFLASGTRKEISMRFDVHPDTVGGIKRRAQWRFATQDLK